MDLQKRVLNCVHSIFQEQDLKKAKRLKKKIDAINPGILEANITSNYITSENLCAIAMFLQRNTDIHFDITDTVLKNITQYNNNNVTSPVILCKTRDYLNRLFPGAVKDQKFFWVMAFDTIYQNMRTTQRYKLTTTNKYLKSLALRQRIQFFVKCLQEIEYEQMYGKSSNLNFFATSRPDADVGEKDEVTNAFESDIFNTSNALKQKNRIQTLQIFAQRLVLTVRKGERDTFWSFLERIVSESPVSSSGKNLDVVLVKAGLPWLIPKTYMVTFSSPIYTSQLCSNIVWKNRPFSFDLIKKKKTFFLEYFDGFTDVQVVENEELMFSKSFERFVDRPYRFILAILSSKKLDEGDYDSLVSSYLKQEKEEKEEKERPEEETKERDLLFQMMENEKEKERDNFVILRKIFETKLYMLFGKNSIPVSLVNLWTQKTGNVNLHPTFLQKINPLQVLDEKFQLIEKMEIPLLAKSSCNF